MSESAVPAVEFPVPAARSSGRRLESIDLLRGLLMILMALDHTRDFFSSATIDPSDPLKSWPSLFTTRWITHVCAPGFIALAGVSIYLQRERGKSVSQMTRLLITRGLWLILIELTVVSFAWTFGPSVILQVIWVVGAAMVLLGLLQRVPRTVVGALGVAMVLLHNLLDSVKASSFGGGEFAWDMFHQFTVTHFHGLFVAMGYPLIPWVGVICIGYAAGPLAVLKPERRQRIATLLGLSLLAVFAVLRVTHGYGDHNRFEHLGTAGRTAMSFMNVEKYPPSLHYLLATFGVLLLLYAVFDVAVTRNWVPAVREVIETYGRVPFFYYVLHLYLLHSVALIFTMVEHLNWHLWTTPGTVFFGHVPGWGLPLWGVYCVWLTVLLVLYLPCLWFSRLKARRRDWWLSYL
jgi:uncharacterized membrane protein